MAPLRPCIRVAASVLVVATPAFAQQSVLETRDPNQAQDEDFARSVAEWTTKPEFMSPLVDHLPTVAGIPSPKDVLVTTSALRRSSPTTYTDAQVAHILNERGASTGAGATFDPDRIRWIRFSAKLKSLKERLIEAGMVTGKQIRAKLGVSGTTLRLSEAPITKGLEPWCPLAERSPKRGRAGRSQPRGDYPPSSAAGNTDLSRAESWRSSRARARCTASS